MTALLDDVDFAGRTVLVRADFNVPLATVEGVTKIIDDGRIRAALPTFTYLVAAGARVVVLAHLGRPKGLVVPALSLTPVAARFGELLGQAVPLLPQVCGDDVADVVSKMSDGDVVMLENVRFDPRETSKDASERGELAASWSRLADAYVGDGFGVVHREQASVTDVARLLPSAAGRLVATELAAFSQVLTDPARPYLVVLGGAKVSDKLAVLDHLINNVDRLLIGGGMAFTFLAAQGYDVGCSLLEESMLDLVRAISGRAAELGVDIVLPTDVVVARGLHDTVSATVVPVNAIPSDHMGLDIGPVTAAAFSAEIVSAQTVVWNGPMGVFEVPEFSAGTRAVAMAMARSAAFTVVGGGDSAAAIRSLGIDESSMSHISTGGGASLELLEGRDLPGLLALNELVEPTLSSTHPPLKES